MIPDEVAALPPRPASVGDWEDLLVRLDIASRAVRVTMEDIVDGEAAARALEIATDREAEVGRLLEVAARLPGAERRPSPAGSAHGDAAALALRFTSLRARTFAMVQRRGLEVWDWQASVDGREPVTVYQLLSWLVRRDAALLAELRGATRKRRVQC